MSAMRMLIVVTDSEVIGAFERGFLESGDRGFTVVPKVVGRGRSGLRTGDRVHPGGSSLLFTVVPEPDAAEALRFLKGIRDQSGAQEVTKIFSLPAEDDS
jgi:hypothetical protein